MNSNTIRDERPVRHIILARDEDDGIGRHGTIPWTCREDMTFFRYATTTTYNPFLKNTVVFGYNTSVSVPPLHDRHVRIMNRDGTVDTPDDTEHIFLGGGASSLRTYLKQCPQDDLPDTVILTRIPGTYACDTFMKDDELRLDQYEHAATYSLGSCHVYMYRRPGLSLDRLPRHIFLLLNGKEPCSS